MSTPTYEDAVKQRIAILQNPRHPFYSEARAYCHRHGLESEDQFMQAIAYLSYKAFMERSEPYRKMKADWLGLYPTTNYVKTSSVGMSIATELNLPDQVKLAFAEIDRVISRIAVECGLVVEENPPKEEGTAFAVPFMSDEYKQDLLTAHERINDFVQEVCGLTEEMRQQPSDNKTKR